MHDGKPRARTALAALGAAALLAAAPAAADEPSGTWTLQLENDRFSNADRHYTHGTRLSWVSEAAESEPRWVADLLQALYPIANIRRGRVGLALGQNMYTPEDTARSDLVVDDRPYAGWLYGAISVHAETRAAAQRTEPDVLDTVELQVGVVGPAALGEEVQNEFHDLIDVNEAQGWDNQLDNEPGVMLIGERRWRTPSLALGGLAADVVPHVGGALGNVMTFANAGAMVRLGQDLEVDYGPPLIRPSLSGLAAIHGSRDFAWYVFAGIEGRATARNIFLDGNTFSDSHHVDKKIFVGDFQFGVAVVIEQVRIALTQVFRTREFDGQDRPDRYGALTLSARF